MLKRGVKVLLACLLLAGLVLSADGSNSLVYLDRVSGQVFVEVLVLLVGGLVISTWKWSHALRLQTLTVPFARLFKALCAGFFLNNFLPTSVGGDAYRIYKTLPSDGHRFRAVAAVAIERGVGFAALLALGGIAAFVAAPRFATAGVVLGALLIVMVAALLATLAARSAVVRQWLQARRQSVVLDAVLKSLSHLRGRADHWLMLTALSFVFQSISISVIYLLFRDVGTEVSWLHCALIAALVGVAAALPISINGIGVAEGALVGAAVALGADYEPALVVAIVRRAVAVTLGVLCGFMYVFEQRSAAAGISRGDAGAASVAGLQPLEHAEEAVVIWELQRHAVLYWNRAAEILYGYARQEALGRDAHELLESRFGESVERIQAALSRHGVWAGAATNRSSDGLDLQVQSRLTLLRQQDGRWFVLETSRRVVDTSSAEAEQSVMARQLGRLTALYSP